jgi:hypothetical protein
MVIAGVLYCIFFLFVHNLIYPTASSFLTLIMQGTQQKSWREVWAEPHSRAPMGVSQEQWQELGFSHTTFYGIVVEKAPGFKRQKHPLTGRDGNVLVMHFDSLGKHQIFANCLSCKLKKFDNPDQPFPLAVNIDNGNLPRLGKCGCVTCNDCVTRSIPDDVNNKSNVHRGYIPCPYCRFRHAHCMDTIAWIFTAKMLEKIALE